MRRWILNSMGAALLAAPVFLAKFGVTDPPGAAGDSTMPGMPLWLSLSIIAGNFLVNWGPALLGGLVLYYANLRRS